MSILANKRSVIVVYSNATDPYSQWVRIVLGEKDVPYDICDADSPIHQQELRELNPYMSVPTLLDRDLVVYKAGIIVEYLDERFPHPPLMPVYPVARARSRLMIFRVERDWYTLMHKIQRGTLSEVEKARQELLDSIVTVAPIFQDNPYFMSEEFSLVDCCIAPLFWRLKSLGIKLPPEAKAVTQYCKRIFERESFQASLTPAERAMGEEEK